MRPAAPRTKCTVADTQSLHACGLGGVDLHANRGCMVIHLNGMPCGMACGTTGLCCRLAVVWPLDTCPTGHVLEYVTVGAGCNLGGGGGGHNG